MFFMALLLANSAARPHAADRVHFNIEMAYAVAMTQIKAVARPAALASSDGRCWPNPAVD
jgi:hypothetical protein